MSAIFKGTGGVILVAEEPAFDADSGTQMFDYTWAGSRAAIFGKAADLEAVGVSYRTSQSGPVYMLTARVPTIQPDETPPDRYEISTESVDRSIFELPAAIAEAEIYDSLLPQGAETFKEWAEKTAVTKRNFIAGNWPVQESIVRHLKGGVTGYQIDLVVLRRFRQCPIEYANSAGQFSLDANNYVYTTGQLNVPAGVAFQLPGFPADPSQDFAWGWRRRSQRVDIVGNYAEQTVELVLAPWSTLAYEVALSPLNW